LHGKRNHICGAFAGEELLIEFCDLLIVNDEDGKLRVRTIQGV
jgi:hypothetical protein